MEERQSTWTNISQEGRPVKPTNLRRDNQDIQITTAFYNWVSNIFKFWKTWAGILPCCLGERSQFNHLRNPVFLFLGIWPKESLSWGMWEVTWPPTMLWEDRTIMEGGPTDEETGSVCTERSPWTCWNICQHRPRKRKSRCCKIEYMKKNHYWPKLSFHKTDKTPNIQRMEFCTQQLK